jgi:hypothetical protein
MGTRGATMVSAFGLLLSVYCSAASAGCDLSGYDQTSPTKVHDDVDNQFARFEWASDVDVMPDQLRVWHYILNKGTRGLGAIWEKAEIRIPITRPLPPGEAFCNRFFADAVLKHADTNAPIKYGTNSQVQRAAVYLPVDAQNDDKTREVLKPPKRSGGETSDFQRSGAIGSHIDTSYADDNGKVVDVKVELTSAPSPKGMYLFLYRSPGLIVGISGFSTALSQAQVDALTNTAKGQAVRIDQGSYAQFTKENSAEALRPLFPERKDLDTKGDFLFFSGQNNKIEFEIPAGSLKKVSTDVVVLDQELHPILATAVQLFAPVKE